MNTLEGLLAIRELLAVPERWTKEVGARDATGKHVNSTSPEAVCWCLVGAAVHFEIPTYPIERALGEAGGFGRSQITEFNDDEATTHPDILALLDRAISSERAKASAS